jgi:hypothetical protein
MAETHVSNSLGDTSVLEAKTKEQVQNDSDVNNFFDQLDHEINDVTYDVTQSEQATQPKEQIKVQDNVGSDGNTDVWETESNPYKKRYSDSSKEAVRLSEQYKEVEPFVPVLEAMKNDSGLVDHVRDYLEKGGTPATTIKEQLNLDENFMYDANEAVSEPDSDSAKVMNAHVDSIVQQRIGQVLDSEKEKAHEVRESQIQKDNENTFKEKYNMDNAQFGSMMEAAKDHTISLEDIYHVLNKDRNAANVRNSTQEDMMSQMRNVRSMPTSQSATNSVDGDKTTEEQLFDSIFGQTAAEDSLFG